MVVFVLEIVFPASLLRLNNPSSLSRCQKHGELWFVLGTDRITHLFSRDQFVNAVEGWYLTLLRWEGERQCWGERPYKMEIVGEINTGCLLDSAIISFLQFGWGIHSFSGQPVLAVTAPVLLVA